MRVGSLFSGIGGLDLGLERAGMKVVWQVEKDPYAQQVLRKNWPDVPITADINNAHGYSACNALDGCAGGCLAPVDIICGGFPCQDLSVAGRGAGLSGSRSGLWAEFARLVGELRPGWVLAENVPALRSRGLGRVLGDISSLGYDAIWDCLPAAAFGAHHIRDRLFLVAWHASNANGDLVRLGAKRDQWQGWQVRAPVSKDSEPLVDGPIDGWSTRPALARMGDGVPSEVDRTRVLGNSVVPQVAEYVGRMILAARAK